MDMKIEQHTLTDEAPIKICLSYAEASSIVFTLGNLVPPGANFPTLDKFLESLMDIILDPHFD